MNINPAANHYKPLDSLITPSRFKNTTFGKGNKISFKSNNKVPGPGAYNIPSAFDRPKKRP
jgi:hypothetical protein